MIMNQIVYTTLIILISIVFPIVSNHGVGDCSKVCASNRLCLESCHKPLDPKVTSDLSTVHCGISSFANNANREPTKRIMNGKEADDREFPWIVSLFFMGDRNKEDGPVWKHWNYCCGTLITTRHVLTAGHCKKRPKILRVLYGKNSLLSTDDMSKSVAVNKVYFHPSFDSRTDISKLMVDKKVAINDIMILELERDINITIDNDKFVVNTVCLPTKDSSPIGGRAMASGWGLNAFDDKLEKLQKTELLVPDYNKCATMMRETKVNDKMVKRLGENILKEKADLFNTNRVICAFTSIPPGPNWVNRSSIPYHGDSGGPLIQYYNNRGHTIGTASAVFVLFNLPIVIYMRVSNNIDFISDVLSGKLTGIS